LGCSSFCGRSVLLLCLTHPVAFISSFFIFQMRWNIKYIGEMSASFVGIVTKNWWHWTKYDSTLIVSSIHKSQNRG
jgi:hypothetical protein